MRVPYVVTLPLLLLAGCGDALPRGDAKTGVSVAIQSAPARPGLPVARSASTTGDAATTDAWLGKWVGVEGLALNIARGDAPGIYRLHLVLLDGANDYVGRMDGDVIRFERDGKTETIRATDGEGTGLKWLAGRKACLVVQPGEGFCRA